MRMRKWYDLRLGLVKQTDKFYAQLCSMLDVDKKCSEAIIIRKHFNVNASGNRNDSEINSHCYSLSVKISLSMWYELFVLVSW